MNSTFPHACSKAVTFMNQNLVRRSLNCRFGWLWFALAAAFLPSSPLGSVVSVTAAFRGNVERQRISETMCSSSGLFGKVFVKLLRCDPDVRFMFDAFDQRGASTSELISDENFVEERAGFLGNGSIKPFEFFSEVFN